MPSPDQSLSLPESDYLYIEASQLHNAGKGLFTAVDIFKDEIIAHFDGEILSKKEVTRRVNLEVDQYFIALLDGKIMDSRNVECFAKYANDAKGYESATFKNNCKISIDDDEAVCLIATKKIRSGEEVFCGYGKRYWKKHR